jgi:hypothetical protein
MLDLCSQTGTVDDIAVCIVSHFDVPVTNTALLSFLGYASAYHHTNKLPDFFFKFLHLTRRLHISHPWDLVVPHTST